MHYRVVYDIAARGYADWPLFGGAVALLLIAIVSGALARRRGKPWRSAGIWFVIAGVYFVVVCAIPYADYWRLCRALRGGEASVAEGKVSDYATARQDVSKTRSKRDIRTVESFRVGGVAFIYYREQPQAGFHNVGGLKIQDGMAMRLHYVIDHGVSDEVRILRVETAP